MVQSIDTDTLNSLETGRGDARTLVLFQLGSGNYGFHTGLGPHTYNGVTYVGAGSLLDSGDIEEGANGEVISITLTLSAVPNSELSPDVLASIESETYHLRPVSIYTVYYDPDTGTELSTELEWVGEIDQITHLDRGGGNAVLAASCSSKSFEYQRIGYRMRDDRDQKIVFADDRGLRHATKSASERIRWGDKDPKKTEGDKGGKGKKKKDK